MLILRVLFVSSEIYPLIKTGGLADVSGALPQALKQLKVDIRLLLPAYKGILAQCKKPKRLGNLEVFSGVHCQLYETTLTNSKVPLILIEQTSLFEREGGPYNNPQQQDWHDNALRFGLLSKVAALLSLPNTLLAWQPDIVHCNDWQTGLTPYFMQKLQSSAKTCFSIHNLAYQGNFHADWRYSLGLDPFDYKIQGYEFHGQLSFMKAGLHYADQLTTVSPHYAQEIQTAAFGFGFEGLLQHRKQDLVGILNGIDTTEWNPEQDPHLPTHYSQHQLDNKSVVKVALLEKFSLKNPSNSKTDKGVSNPPVLAVVSRLAYQKGLDMLLTIAPKLLQSGCKLLILGSGEKGLEEGFLKLQADYPTQVGVHIGYNEPLSHLMMAGADIFVMPSRFEPCGLNQLYGLRYGTISVVNSTGGLADSIQAYDVNRPADHPSNKKATGFVMESPNAESLLVTLAQAMSIYEQRDTWKKLQNQAMEIDISWQNSAKRYISCYASLLKQ